MTFGKKLRTISEDISFELKLWEEMKKLLTEIASDGHPKGCFVKLEGTRSYKEALISIMKADEVLYTDIEGTNEPEFGVVYWGEKGESFDKVKPVTVSVFAHTDGGFYIKKYPTGKGWLKANIDLKNISFI